MAKMYLYHEEKAPKGFLFEVKHVENHIEELDSEGWVDSPKGFKLPPEMPQISDKKAKTMKPDELIGLVKGMGFLVMSKEQFAAEIEKAVQLSKIEPPKLPEETAKTPDEIMDIFDSNPEALTKDELIEMGNELYDLGLTRSMKEATLISKIQEARG